MLGEINPTPCPSIYLDGIVMKQKEDLFRKIKGLNKSGVWKGKTQSMYCDTFQQRKSYHFGHS